MGVWAKGFGVVDHTAKKTVREVKQNASATRFQRASNECGVDMQL